MKNGLAKILKVLFLFTFSLSILVTVLIILEIVARKLNPEGETHIRYSPYFIYENIPKSSWTNSGPEFKINVLYNSDGFRDREFPKEKTENVFRIAIVGDSFVAAEQVEFEQIFTQKLEKQLNLEKDPKRFEVINFGVNGYNADSELVLLREKVKQYTPDLVILVFFFNDLDGILNSPLISVDDRKITYDYLDRKDKETQLVKIGRQITSKSRLWDFIVNKKLAKVPNLAIFFYRIKSKLLGGETIGDVQNQRSINRWIGYRYYSPTTIRTFLNNTPADIEKLYGQEKVVLAEMKQIVKSWNGQFVVVVASAPIQFRQQQKEEALKYYGIDEADFNPIKPNTTVIKLTKDLSIPSLDLYQDIKSNEEQGRPMHFTNDVHWNNEGHAVVANSLEKFLIMLYYPHDKTGY